MKRLFTICLTLALFTFFSCKKNDVIVPETTVQHQIYSVIQDFPTEKIDTSDHLLFASDQQLLIAFLPSDTFGNFKQNLQYTWTLSKGDTSDLIFPSNILTPGPGSYEAEAGYANKRGRQW